MVRELNRIENEDFDLRFFSVVKHLLISFVFRFTSSISDLIVTGKRLKHLLGQRRLSRYNLVNLHFYNLNARNSGFTFTFQCLKLN